MNHLLCCTCGEVIVKSMSSETKVRSKVLVIRDGSAFAVCKGCDAEVRVPLNLDLDLLKTLSTTKPTKTESLPHLYVRQVRKNT